MLPLRSLAFNAAFYVNTFLQLLLWAPLFFLLPRRRAWLVPKFWARSNLALLEWTAGTRSRIEGLENLPDGPFILAAKHQSAWETLALFPHLSDPVYILKRELTWIPLFGWYLAKMRMVPIDRSRRAQALKEAIRITRLRVEEGRQLIIFPEGTRRAPGAEPAYKLGVAEIYDQLKLPVVPVAHVAGLYWPRRRFLRHPGTIRALVLPAIPAGLPKREMFERLIAQTEGACDRLLAEAALSENPPPLPATARERLQALGIAVPPA